MAQLGAATKSAEAVLGHFSHKVDLSALVDDFTPEKVKWENQPGF